MTEKPALDLSSCIRFGFSGLTCFVEVTSLRPVICPVLAREIALFGWRVNKPFVLLLTHSSEGILIYFEPAVWMTRKWPRGRTRQEGKNNLTLSQTFTAASSFSYNCITFYWKMLGHKREKIKWSRILVLTTKDKHQNEGKKEGKYFSLSNPFAITSISTERRHDKEREKKILSFLSLTVGHCHQHVFCFPWRCL